MEKKAVLRKMMFEELFSRWEKEFDFQAFIRDGIVDQENYKRPYILFVLREMNCDHKRDLREDLYKYGSGHKTWNNVGRWVKALLDGEEEYPYDMEKNERAKQMRRVAVLNLKKEGGASRVVGEELTKAVEQHKAYIYEQIKLCDPDLIICAGLPTKGAVSNAELLYENVFENRSEWKSFPSVALPKTWYYYEANISGKNVPVISFCHPQVTCLCGKRGHEGLYKPLYEDMLWIRDQFLKK